MKKHLILIGKNHLIKKYIPIKNISFQISIRKKTIFNDKRTHSY